MQLPSIVTCSANPLYSITSSPWLSISPDPAPAPAPAREPHTVERVYISSKSEAELAIRASQDAQAMPGDIIWHSQRSSYSRWTRLLSHSNSAFYFIGVACLLIGWHSGWFEAPDIQTTKTHKTKNNNITYEGRRPILGTLEKADHVVKSYFDSSASWLSERRNRHFMGSGNTRSTAGPFSTFSCAGDGLAANDIYAKPFRFHVYDNLPKDILEDTMLNASKYWQADHR